MIISEQFAESLLYSYDLRSCNISVEEALFLGQGFGSELILLKKRSVCVGYDRRVLSKILCEAFVEGLVSVGIHVFFLGQVGTPVVQYMAIQLKLDAVVAVTASHNPIGYHGFKFFIDNVPFCEISLQKLILRCLNKDFFVQNRGSVETINLDPYLDFLNSIEIKGKFKVGWDLLNGCGGDVLPKLSLKGENIVLNSECIKDFGGYPPDPGCIERLTDILNLQTTDFSFLIDGDADRTSLLYNQEVIRGDIFFGMLIYLKSLQSQQKIRVVWDDISSFVVKQWTNQFSEAYISKTGHSNIHNIALQRNCFVAGELSGHYMFKDMYYIDDGIYSSLQFISYLEASALSLNELLRIVPQIFVQKLPSILCLDYLDKQKKILILKNYLVFRSIHFIEFDGIKILLRCGHLIIRASHTESIIRVLAEGKSQEDLASILLFYETILHLF